MRPSWLCGVLILVLTAAAAAQSPRRAVLVGATGTYVVNRGDTLTSIAARHGVTIQSIADGNGLTISRPLAAGAALRIDNRHLASVDPQVALTINIPQRMLFLVEGERVSAYPVTVGSAGWPTPVGPFTIAMMEKDPTWDVPVSIQKEMAEQGNPVVTKVPPSPQNPLGTRWLGLSLRGLGIHGTNTPSSIYRYGSHGCIRMHPDHVVELFDRVSVGMTGVLIYEPVMLAVIERRVWLEVHPDPYRRAAGPLSRARAIAADLGAAGLIDWSAVEAAVRRRDGRPHDVTLVPAP
jgi:L,D-transpeptidase ErfK/SrfK